MCQGQTIGAIIANDQSIAQKASKLVQVEYEELSPIIVSLEVNKMNKFNQERNTFHFYNITDKKKSSTNALVC